MIVEPVVVELDGDGGADGDEAEDARAAFAVVQHYRGEPEEQSIDEQPLWLLAEDVEGGVA